MAKKRKLAQNSIPTSNFEPEPEAQSEPEPEPEPIEEDQPPIKEEEEDAANEEEKDDDDGGEEEEEEEGEEEEEDEDQQAQPLEKTIPFPDPAAAPSNGSADAGDDQEESDPEAIQKILELFPKDQLVELLRDAAVKHADLRNEVHRIADVDPAHRKIFVHGLGWDTNAKILTEVFNQFGEIEDCNAVTDKATGRSKGYGFILFKHRKGAQNALKEPQKKIGGRMTACQLASAGPGPGPGSVQPPAPPVSEYTQRKIFVSNVGADVDPKKLLEFFAKFGEIEEGPLGLDKATGKPRGFCLFVYKSTESVKKALEEPHKNFEGRVLHCQKAIDGPKTKYQYQYQSAAGAQYPGAANGPKGNFSGGVGHVPAAGGHLMAPSAIGQGYNPAVAATGPATGAVPGLNPALNQALTAILLGGLGSAAGGPMVNQGVPGQMGNSGMQGGYGGGQMGGLAGYGGQAPAQGGYGGSQMGQGGSVRGQQGYGHAGGGPPYMGHH